MHVNSISNNRPAFQARFADDNETKSVLIQNVQPYDYPGQVMVYSSISILDKIDNDDKISLKKLPVESGDFFYKYLVKNDTTGKQIKVSPGHVSLFEVLNKILADSTCKDHKKLFKNSKLDIDFSTGKFYRQMNKELYAKTGADILEEKRQALFEKNNQLENEIKNNKKKIDEISVKQSDLCADYILSLIG